MSDIGYAYHYTLIDIFLNRFCNVLFDLLLLNFFLLLFKKAQDSAQYSCQARFALSHGLFLDDTSLFQWFSSLQLPKNFTMMSEDFFSTSLWLFKMVN